MADGSGGSGAPVPVDGGAVAAVSLLEDVWRDRRCDAVRRAVLSGARVVATHGPSGDPVKGCDGGPKGAGGGGVAALQHQGIVLESQGNHGAPSRRRPRQRRNRMRSAHPWAAPHHREHVAEARSEGGAAPLQFDRFVANMLMWLVGQGVPPSLLWDPQGSVVLEMASSDSWLPALKWVYKIGGARALAPAAGPCANVKETAPLFCACQHGAVAVVGWMMSLPVEQRAALYWREPTVTGDPSFNMPTDFAPLWAACRHGHAEVAQMLVAANPRLLEGLAMQYGPDCETLWMSFESSATHAGICRVAQWLHKQESFPLLLQATNRHGHNILDIASAQPSKFGRGFIQLLLASPYVPALLAARDSLGCTPFARACQNDPVMARWLAYQPTSNEYLDLETAGNEQPIDFLRHITADTVFLRTLLASLATYREWRVADLVRVRAAASDCSRDSEKLDAGASRRLRIVRKCPLPAWQTIGNLLDGGEVRSDSAGSASRILGINV